MVKWQSGKTDKSDIAENGKLVKANCDKKGVTCFIDLLRGWLIDRQIDCSIGRSI